MNINERRILKAKDALQRLGPFVPGSISTQWNVCGKAGCRCKDHKKPQKHGPYHQLSFTLEGKSSTMFIKKSQLSLVRECVKRYRQFRHLNNALLQAYLEWVSNGGLEQTKEAKQ